MIALWAHVVGSALFRVVPRRVGYVLADLLGPLVARAWGGQYARAAANMRRVLGPGASPRAVGRNVREVFRNYARYAIDVLCLPSMSRAELERLVDVVGWEHVVAAVARGKGVILLTGHVGNWDVPAALLAKRGYPVNGIVERLEPPAWNDRVQAIRERVGIRPIPMETGAREMFACLKRNEVLAVLVDRPLAAGGVPVRFFGRETRVPEGVARLALRTDATVLGAVGLRRGGRFVAVVSPPLAWERTGDRERDVAALTQAVFTWLESRVRRWPTQWYMFRDFWPNASGDAPPPGAVPARPGSAEPAFDSAAPDGRPGEGGARPGGHPAEGRARPGGRAGQGGAAPGGGAASDAAPAERAAR